MNKEILGDLVVQASFYLNAIVEFFILFLLIYLSTPILGYFVRRARVLATTHLRRSKCVTTKRRNVGVLESSVLFCFIIHIRTTVHILFSNFKSHSPGANTTETLQRDRYRLQTFSSRQLSHKPSRLKRIEFETRTSIPRYPETRQLRWCSF